MIVGRIIREEGWLHCVWTQEKRIIRQDKVDTPIECYNLFLQKYENMDAELFNNLENIYSTYVKCQETGKFVRSYKNFEKEKEEKLCQIICKMMK